ncbi:MAG: serine hydrolase [Bacteroides sp.]|nr:serine hydrolase [Bacteroides sp.]
MKPKKVILFAVLLAVAGCVAVLVFPGNHYVRRALVHTYPKIDQYPIFENRVVRAGNPVPLEFAPGVSGRRIDSAFEADFARYGTVAFLLKKATGRNIADYASEKIWTPIEAEEDALWSLDRKDGMEKAYCCFNSNARDFARLGQLVLQNGYWHSKNGRVSVVDSAYVAQATSPASYLKAVLPDGTEAPCTMYGYQFWLMNYKGHEVKYFRGILGQYIMVIPDLDMVVVRLGHKRASEYNVEWDYPVDMDVWLEAACLEREKS